MDHLMTPIRAIVNAPRGDDPEWAELRESPHFEMDLRRALAGEKGGFCELAVYGKFRPRIIRDLWKAGASVRSLHDILVREWRVSSASIVEALGDNLDEFFRDAGFTTARLPKEFDVWRGGDEPSDVMARSRSWTRSYSVACAFALQYGLWRNARLEPLARAEGRPEPLVLIRRIRRDQAVAWIGGPESEVVLAKGTAETPTQPCGSIRDWRRHRSRTCKEFFWS
jgi:hypothetical protein